MSVMPYRLAWCMSRRLKSDETFSVMVDLSPVGSLGGLPGFLRIAFHHRQAFSHVFLHIFSICLQRPRPVPVCGEVSGDIGPEVFDGLDYRGMFRHFLPDVYCGASIPGFYYGLYIPPELVGARSGPVLV